MIRTMLTAAEVIAVMYFGLCAALFALQRSLIYFPPPPSPGPHPRAFTLSVEGADVCVTVRVHSGPNAVMYFGGNAEDVGQSLPALLAAFPDDALYLMNYRGYGGSSGTPSEAALFADSLALFDRVRSDHETVVLVGRSLGSGVAVHLASRRPVSRLVLVTPFDSLRELAARQFPYLPVRYMLRDKFESSRFAGAITAPTLVIAAEHDEVIPRRSTESLLTRFRTGVASLVVVPGVGHNTISGHPDYIHLLTGVP